MSGPRVGSRPWMLLRMQPGESLCLEVRGDSAPAFMQQVQTDIWRNGLTGKRRQELLLALHPATRAVYEIVRITVVEETTNG